MVCSYWRRYSGFSGPYGRIANIEVPCYVLEGGQRVITMGGLTDTLNIARGGSMKRGMSRLELFVSGKLIKPYVSSDLDERVRNPIKFRNYTL